MNYTFISPGQLLKPHKCVAVYQVECPECPLTYIGETGRTQAKTKRMKDHDLRNPLTAVGEQTHHKLTQDIGKVFAKDDIWCGRKVRDAIKIKVRKSGINHDQGYKFPPIYDELLLSCDRRHGDHVTAKVSTVGLKKFMKTGREQQHRL